MIVLITAAKAGLSVAPMLAVSVLVQVTSRRHGMARRFAVCCRCQQSSTALKASLKIWVEEVAKVT